MDELEVVYPDWYDELAEFECEAKGYLEGVDLRCGGFSCLLNFYDAVRLIQDSEEEIKKFGLFYMRDVVIVESVTKENIEAAARKIHSCIKEGCWGVKCRGAN